MDEQPVSERLRVRRRPERGRYDAATVHAILDEALFCTVATVRDGSPVALPMAHSRDGDALHLHGSIAAGLFRDARRGSSVCVSATLVDGLVLAGSSRNHSMNYRSVTVYGDARPLESKEEKLHALRLLMERTAPGRWGLLRVPTSAELADVGVWQLSLAEASAKVRDAPPSDESSAAWVGVLPVTQTWGAPQAVSTSAQLAPPPPA